MQLKGKVALITGAGSGIGKASALLMAAEGAQVGLLGRKEDELQQVGREIGSAGGDCMVLVADVSQPLELQKAVQQLTDRWGRLDIVFANAGINGLWAPIEDLPLEEWEQTLRVNLTGTFLTVKYALPYLKVQGGSVIITSSVNGTRIFSNTGATAYSCSKAAQVAFAKMMALELARYRIRVNVICPGAIETNIDDSTRTRGVEDAREPVEFPEGSIPLTDGEPGAAEDVARLALFLASGHAKHISGTEVWIDGAQSLLQG